MRIDLAPSISSARHQQIAAAIDAGAGTACLRLYTAPVPIPGGAITTQILLTDHAIARPCTKSISGNQFTLKDLPAAPIQATGQAAWCRIVGGDGNWVLDGDVGDGLSGKFIQIVDGTMLYEGGTLNINVNPITG